MAQKNITSFTIIQSNKKYILTTSLLDDKIKIDCQNCQDSNMTFSGVFSLMDLMKLSKYFLPEYTIDKVQFYINGIIEKGKSKIEQDDGYINIILYLINHDTIKIPLLKKLKIPSNHITSNQFSKSPNSFNQKDNIEYNNYSFEDIDKLNKQLFEERNKNMKLEEIINNLNNMIKNLSKENEHLKNELNKLNQIIKEKNEEIQDYKFKNSNIKEIKSLITSINPGEKVFSVLFMTQGSQDIINYCMACKNTDLFVRLEEKLYNDFPKFRNYETFFMVNAKKILRFKTLDENNIKNNDIIHLFVNEINQ